SLQDERNTYVKWAWSSSPSKEPSAVTEPVSAYTIVDPDVHGETEGDDLWTYLMMYRRSNNAVYLNRANAWATYFKTNYQCVNNNNYCYDLNNYGLDHAYGWGLVALYEANGDADALTAAQRIGADIEALWNKSTALGANFSCYSSEGCMNYGFRA